jgi:oxalate decarboxylase/phosphoglucose isomerase-like protein (cupin superfamily)
MQRIFRPVPLLVLLMIGTAAAAPPATEASYVHKMSKDPWVNFPGGRVKASRQSELPATTMAGALMELRPGGVREPHWHDAAEWAYVINGTCIATALNEGRTHPTDTWNFTTGDVWYFPANTAHAVAGAPPTGCVFVVGWNAPDVDERDAISASSWLASLPKDALAQVSCSDSCGDSCGDGADDIATRAMYSHHVCAYVHIKCMHNNALHASHPYTH